MKKLLLKKSSGFTLVEIMIAVVLFSILSVAVYSLLKSSMDSTLKQKTQEAANTNAKAILSTISADLKSSSVIEGSFLAGGNSTQYLSSVICPATGEASTADLGQADLDNLNPAPGFKALDRDDLINIDGLGSIARNYNRLVFYRRVINNNSVDFNIIEYGVEVDQNTHKCRLQRKIYNWNNVTTWTGLNLSNGINESAIDNQDFTFNAADLNGMNPATEETIVELPNEGDAIILYTARTFDDTFTPRRLSANQYFIKVIVLQTARSNPDPLDYDAFQYQAEDGTFFNVNNFVNNDRPTDTLKNYRVAELDTIVNVLSSLTSN